jgi:hypothetical protein
VIEYDRTRKHELQYRHTKVDLSQERGELSLVHRKGSQNSQYVLLFNKDVFKTSAKGKSLQDKLFEEDLIQK